MEIYSTKKLANAEDLFFDIPETLPYLHIITPEVIVKCDNNGRFYIADCPSDKNFITNLIKLKKVICKNSFKPIDATDKDKYKLQDEILWVKQSPIMIYKDSKHTCGTTKMTLNHPISLQLSYTFNNFYGIPKPYNIYNMFWTIDYVTVSDDFKWDALIK
jgi:hypothetical protein